MESDTANPASAAVILPCYNEAETLPAALESVAAQTLQPEAVIVAEGGSTDRSPVILDRWADRLPLTVLDNPRRRQAPGLNRGLRETDTKYVARLDGHSRWNEIYLERLVGELEENDELAAAGGSVHLDPESNTFQRVAWTAMTHPFGAGGPAYRESNRRRKVSTLQSPVYRLQTLREVDFFREDLPWAEDDELHHRLRENNGELMLNPAAKLYYQPRREWRSFTGQFHNYGRGRGQLAAEGIFPTLRHWRLDKLLALWTFLLCWNPVGWGLGLVHLFVSLAVALRKSAAHRANIVLFFLFPLMHGAYWLGWLRTRFHKLLSAVS